MKEVTPIGSRKSDHIRINLEQDVQSGLSTGLENYRFIHHAMPEIDLKDVDLNVNLFGKTLQAPILISSMTGGTCEAHEINQLLATAAQQENIAMGVGSQRIALENPQLAYTFQVRQQAPDALLFANLGAVQLNYGYGLAECQRAVDMIEADALVLHINPLQEALQIDGNTDFSGLLKKIEAVCSSLPVPVIAKEVGWGFSEEDLHRLYQAGVKAIDVAGAGGTSWSQVEMYRAVDDTQQQLASAFTDWGIPTADVIENASNVAPQLTIIASGGLRNGIDIAKCLALGASIGGMAGPFLKAASHSMDEIIKLIHLFKNEIRICMFATGSLSINRLRDGKLIKK
jgi:isopentenyl-diphosphate delta-isomerase